MLNGSALETAVAEARNELSELITVFTDALKVVASVPEVINAESLGVGGIIYGIDAEAGGDAQSALHGITTSDLASNSAHPAATSSARNPLIPESTDLPTPLPTNASDGMQGDATDIVGGSASDPSRNATTANGSRSHSSGPVGGAHGGQGPSHTDAARDIAQRLGRLRAATTAALEASSNHSASLTQGDSGVSEDELAAMVEKRNTLRRNVGDENLKLKRLIDQLRDLHRDIAVLIDVRRPDGQSLVPQT